MHTTHTPTTDILASDAPLRIVSGEGTVGHVEEYTGAHTVRALRARLTRERCGGDRWARVEYLVVPAAESTTGIHMNPQPHGRHTMSISEDDLTTPSTRSSDVCIYWDDADPENTGPAWVSEDGSGRLDLVGWSDGSVDGGGRNVAHYFNADGLYLGPDCDGVYPILA
jgi:hypothetical protein